MPDNCLGRPQRQNAFQARLESLKRSYHSHCIFNRKPPVEDLHFRFLPNGILITQFVCTGSQQGYDGVAHGGIIAAIIDASMVQCCMGHNLLSVTVDLSISYKKPVLLNKQTVLETRISGKRRGRLVFLQSEIQQEGNPVVSACGRFFVKP